MKIKIADHAGWNGRHAIFIERGGKFMAQACPFSHAENLCGDWCPHFGEPEPHLVSNSPDTWPTYYHQDGLQLRLCHGTVLTGKIIDERVRP